MLQKFLSFNIIVLFLLFLTISNLIALDYFLFSKNSSDILKNKETKEIDKESKAIKPLLEPSVTLIPNSSISCPDSCIIKINEATSSIKISQAPSKQLTSEPSSQTSSGAKEFFIPLGSGSNSTDDWSDVTGVQAYIDSTQYLGIKKVVFEASVNIPTGNQKAWVRLYNVTDKHPVWSSELSIEGGTSKLLVSDPITLDAGNKLYQVQMKTQLKFPANLSQARIHITTY